MGPEPWFYGIKQEIPWTEHLINQEVFLRYVKTKKKSYIQNEKEIILEDLQHNAERQLGEFVTDRIYFKAVGTDGNNE